MAVEALGGEQGWLPKRSHEPGWEWWEVFQTTARARTWKERSGCIPVTEDLSLGTLGLGFSARLLTVEMERNQGIPRTVSLDRLHGIWGEWGIPEVCTRCGCLGGLTRGGDLCGDSKFYSGSVKTPK